jgi:cysteine desulfurase family protein (TIGR01976 family)
MDTRAATDVTSVRQRFPALRRTGPDGRPFVFADAPGGSQVPESVIEAMSGRLREGVSNTHGAFVTSREVDELISIARVAASDLTGADPHEIVFGPNATTLLLSLSRSFGRTLRPGDEIVVTRLDHDANIRPWLQAAEDAGATVRWVDVRTDDVTLDLASFDEAIGGGHLRLVAFTLASNAVGTMPPAAELVRRAHEAGAVVVVDAVHFAQHRSLDLHALGADVLACSPYKVFGPHLGLLAVRRELLDAWTPYKLRAAPSISPDRWETGTQNHEGMAGFVAAVEYLADVGRALGEPADDTRRSAIGAAFELFGVHERALALRFLDGLRRLPAVRLFGIADPGRIGERTPTFAIRVGDEHPLATAEQFASQGIFVWDGHYYALELMERLGLQATGGAVRIGFCHYHTADEVDRVLESLASLS